MMMALWIERRFEMKGFITTMASVFLAASPAQAQQPDLGNRRLSPEDVRMVAPALEKYTQAHLYGDVWKRPDLSRRDRSIVSLAVLITRNHFAPLNYYLGQALDNGVKPAGTVGIADICAPSWQARSYRDVRYLNEWLSQGFAVVATDYQGLGTPGPHPYLKVRPEAYSVLDSVRAVLRDVPGLANKIVIIGQSQGGGAAFATAAFAPDYAPELDIRGSVATGIPYLAPKAIASARPSDIHSLTSCT
jgi:alkylhydroperoxidase/carboxymuconolactone decarboxylase family protein YurZ